MNAQITKPHNNVVAVQPVTTFHKDDRMKKQSSTTLKLAMLVAMVITTALSAVAQDDVVGGPGSTYYNPLQVALKAWYVGNEVVGFSEFYGGANAEPYTLSQPNALTFDGSNIWIANAGSNKVMKIRASDDQFQASYSVKNPGAMAFDGERIWVDHRTATGGNTVSVLFASNGLTALPDIAVGNQPNYMIWDGWGMWVVANDSTFKRIDNWGNTYCSGKTPGGGRDYGVAFDGNNTWITDSTNSKVYEYTWQCVLIQTVSVSGGPIGIVFDGTNMWTANQNNGTVAQITPSGGVSEYTVGGAPWQVAFDGANIWVTTQTGNTVQKVAAFGSNVGKVMESITPCINSGGPVPFDLAFDGASMWVTCPSNNAVGKM
jgi:hypothetical protein